MRLIWVQQAKIEVRIVTYALPYESGTSALFGHPNRSALPDTVIDTSANLDLTL
jgi:hypothetical protein